MIASTSHSIQCSNPYRIYTLTAVLCHGKSHVGRLESRAQLILIYHGAESFPFRHCCHSTTTFSAFQVPTSWLMQHKHKYFPAFFVFLLPLKTQLVNIYLWNLSVLMLGFIPARKMQSLQVIMPNIDGVSESVLCLSSCGFISCCAVFLQSL